MGYGYNLGVSPRQQYNPNTGVYNNSKSIYPDYSINRQDLTQPDTYEKSTENPLWKALKSDTAAVVIGSIVSSAAILIMILSPKSGSINSKPKKSVSLFSKLKTKWANYRADYKARMAAKAPERNIYTPYIIR